MLKMSLGRGRFFLSFLGKVQVVSLKEIFGDEVDMGWCVGSWRLAISIMAALSVAKRDESTKCRPDDLLVAGVCVQGLGLFAGG